LRVVITVDGDPHGIRSLYQSVLDDPGLDDAELVMAEPVDGSLSGGLAQAVSVLTHDDGAAAALASVVIAWIRSKRWRLKVTLTRPDGTKYSIDSTGPGTETAERLIAEAALFMGEQDTVRADPQEPGPETP
jgi:Effector Associated Constant Component 1